ncbi:hypothetical protein AGMMS49991_10210 [Spirochaetia bacterium]|nr:hypothetical protein AGMMS49991_10210 [Spirochaetia bacterium]
MKTKILPIVLKIRTKISPILLKIKTKISPILLKIRTKISPVLLKIRAISSSIGLKIKDWLAHLPPSFRQTAFFVGCLAALILAAGLVWFFTRPVRSAILAQSVNEALDRSGITLHLEEPLSHWGKSGRAAQLGQWFTISEDASRAVVFPLMDRGIPAAVLAVVSANGEVDTLIPLSGNAVQLLPQLSPETLGLYIRRVKESHALLGGR